MKKLLSFILLAAISSQSGCHIILGYLLDGPPKEGRKDK
jgi:hypothetical protein